VAQSGLSASIRTLERELGATLFLRSTRQVELTEAGRALLVEARRALTNVAAAKDAVAAVQGLLRGRLAVGTLQCLCTVDLPGILSRFSRAHPGVDIQLRHDSSGALVEQVRAGRLDVAFVTRPVRIPDEVMITPLDTMELMLACGPDHPFADRDRVDLRELDGLPFVDYHPDWGTRETVDRLLAANCVDRHVALEVNDVHSLLDLVGNGLGVAILPGNFVHKGSRARFVPLTGDAPVWETAIVTPASHSAAASVLLDMVAPRSRLQPV
jgi:DNA-binding transcriptional LysR family regulator